MQNHNGQLALTLIERISCCVLSLAFLSYGILGLLRNDLYLPNRWYTKGYHLQGGLAWLCFVSFCAFAAVFSSLLVAHYNRKGNVTGYRKFLRVAAVLGIVTFVLSLALHVFVFPL